MSTIQKTTTASKTGAWLLDYDQAAAYLGTTPRHVRHLWQTRRISAVKVGSLVRFRRQDLDKFISDNVVPAAR